MFSKIVFMICTIFTCLFNNNYKPINSIKECDNEMTSLVEDIVPQAKRSSPNSNDLYLEDYYSNYYFVNSIENYGRNVKGSCTQLSLALLLSYLDTYWDDSLVPENYEKKAELYTNQLSYIVDSPGIVREPKELVNNLSTYDYYWNVVDKKSDDYFHLLIIKIGYEQFRYYDFDDPDYPCGLGNGQINKIASYYLFDYLEKEKSDYSITTNGLFESTRDFTIRQVKNGIPVLVRGLLSYGGFAGGHAMVAYDYDEENDQLYFHAGWEEDSRHRSESDLHLVSYWDAMSIVPKKSHIHTTNYIYTSVDYTKTYCPCNFVIPTEIGILNNYLDESPFIYWDTLIKEKWFKSIGLYHELFILDLNRHIVYEKSKINNNEYTLTKEEFAYALGLSTNYYYIYIGLASDVDPYWDDYYCVQKFDKPNRYNNKYSILPSDWGFKGRYYFTNELTGTHLSTEPERKNTNVSVDDFIVTTDRLRCGYIEDIYVVLSPRRENAGRAYFEMNFNKAVYSFMYRACMWSSSENLDGIAIIQVKNASGDWTTLKDIPLSLLKTKSNGLTQFIEQTPQGIYGLRFETTATATGTRNKGRFCIDDIVFSTKSGVANNTYVSYDYSTKV